MHGGRGKIDLDGYQARTREAMPQLRRRQAFRGLPKIRSPCDFCGLNTDAFPSDDFPPYLTILIVGHNVVPLMLAADRAGVSLEAQMAIWVPVTLVLTLAFLPRVKGGIIGLMWSTERGAA